MNHCKRHISIQQHNNTGFKNVTIFVSPALGITQQSLIQSSIQQGITDPAEQIKTAAKAAAHLTAMLKKHAHKVQGA